MLDPDLLWRIPGLLLALTIYAYARARVAYSFGDPTPKVTGHLTLNPIAHLDPWGLLMMLLLHFGWAKPVPVNVNYFKDSRAAMFWVSFAGPIANLLSALTLTVLAVVLLRVWGILPDKLMLTINLAISFNIVFALFNLLPIPPLDGASVLSNYVHSPKLDEFFARIEPYGMFILLALIYLGIVGKLIGPVSSLIYLLLRQLIFVLL